MRRAGRRVEASMGGCNKGAGGPRRSRGAFWPESRPPRHHRLPNKQVITPQRSFILLSGLSATAVGESSVIRLGALTMDHVCL